MVLVFSISNFWKEGNWVRFSCSNSALVEHIFRESCLGTYIPHINDLVKVLTKLISWLKKLQNRADVICERLAGNFSKKGEKTLCKSLNNNCPEWRNFNSFLPNLTSQTISTRDMFTLKFSLRPDVWVVIVSGIDISG